MGINILLLLLGLALLIKGADWLIENASSLAKKFNVSNLTIGLTIVAFGTSAPELAVNVYASIQNSQELVLGNIIGSNIFNILAILGIAGCITPLVVQSSIIRFEIPLAILSTALVFVLFSLYPNTTSLSLSRFESIILLILFIFFLVNVYRQLKHQDSVVEDKPKIKSVKLVFMILVGFVLLVFGGNLVIKNAVFIASKLGASQQIIGLTIIAAGTSLPELATSVTAALKKQNDIAVGNIIGSNIFNICFILPINGLIQPIVYNTSFNSDIVILIVATIFLYLAMYLNGKKKLDRIEAAILLIFYLGYTSFLVFKEISN